MEKPHAAAAQCPTPSTTFVQADAATFKELVQRLTGPHDAVDGHRCQLAQPAPSDAATSSTSFATKRAGQKRLHERRQRSRLNLAIPKPGSLSSKPAATPYPAMAALASPSDAFADLDISEENEDDQERMNEEEEERAIKERRFYLHPSPRSRTRMTEPELLPLFPLTSPRKAAGEP
ncbi:hypothetical protein Cni_G23058 [Canna indica]|uniref:VQ domain-containing protein n=1 Tax=Canna indica TaxID=4628 RepID=A0AAQ3QLV8_9LILI|nr:hypothetical protein Cni_G23058 [Canna indica]